MSQVPFDRVLAALKDNSTAFPLRYYENLSDLNTAQLNQFLAAWREVSPTRKRKLIENLEAFYKEEMTVSYDALAKALLDDAEAKVRVYAIRILWENGEPRVARELIRILADDPVEEVRAEAAGVLGSFIYDGEIERLNPVVLKEVEDALITAAENGSMSVQRRAVESLGFSSRPEAAGLIEAAFRRREVNWLVSALFAMGRSAHPEKWQDFVIGSFSHENDEVRAAAYSAAGELQLKDARQAMLSALEEEQDEDLIRALVWSLSQIGGEDVRTYLEALLDEIDDEDMEEYVEEALENLAFTEDMAKFDLLSFDPDAELDEDE